MPFLPGRRGCTGRCASAIRVAVVEALVEGIRKGGYDETSLASLSPADYSCVRRW